MSLLRIHPWIVIFQSTLSVRKATDDTPMSLRFFDISIHALREESDRLPRRLLRHQEISIHALREESDEGDAGSFHVLAISIHALREESDRRG